MFSLLRVAGLTLILLCLTFTIWLVNELIRNFQLTNAWQPWVTAFGVIAAAWFAIWQQNKIEEREARQRRRKSVAARAIMPAALAEICEYAEQCAATVKVGYPSGQGGTIIAGTIPVPKFPSDAIKVLRDCIEHGDDKDIAKISILIGKLQVQNTRITPFLLRSDFKTVTAHNYDMFLSDIIDLHACCASLFPYARFEDVAENCQTYEQLIRASASCCNIYDYAYPHVFEYMRRIGLIG